MLAGTVGGVHLGVYLVERCSESRAMRSEYLFCATESEPDVAAE